MQRSDKAIKKRSIHIFVGKPQRTTMQALIRYHDRAT